MTKPKRQHWVPRFYLKYFSTPDSKRNKEKIWVIRPDNDKDPQKRSIREVTIQNYLYSVLSKDGKVDFHLENKLGLLEDDISRLWKELSSNIIDYSSSDVRQGIALFAAVQLLRNPYLQKKFNETVDLVENYYENASPTLVDGIMKKIVRVNGKPMPIGAEEWKHYKKFELPEIKEMWHSAINREATDFAEKLLQKRWSILVSENSDFITSDFPVYVANSELKKYQIAAKGAIIFFPISPERVLRMDDKNGPNNTYMKVTKNAALSINIMTCMNADKVILSSREPLDVMPEINDFFKQAIDSPNNPSTLTSS